MQLINTNINTLPVLDSLDQQQHRKPWGVKCPVIIPFDRLLPFQIITETTVDSLIIEVYDLNDEIVCTIDNTESGVDYTSVFQSIGDYSVFYNKGNVLSDTFSNDLMYCKYNFKDSTVSDYSLYSEIFQPANDTTDIVKYEWWSNLDISIDNTGYKILSQIDGGYFPFRAYFVSNIEFPNGLFNKLAEERLTDEYLLSVSRDMTYNFGFRTTKTQYQSITGSALADYIAVTYRGDLYKVRSIDFDDRETDEKGGTAWVNVVFKEEGTVLRKNMPAKPTRGDYNDDYNIDFF